MEQSEYLKKYIKTYAAFEKAMFGDNIHVPNDKRKQLIVLFDEFFKTLIYRSEITRKLREIDEIRKSLNEK